MEKITTEYEVKGDYNFIRKITHTFFTTSDGVEHQGNTHRHPQHVPGTLVEGVYVKTDVDTLDDTAKVFANHLWTDDVHTAYEALLVTKQAEYEASFESQAEEQTT